MVHRGGRHQGSQSHPGGSCSDGRQHTPGLVGITIRYRSIVGIGHVVISKPDTMPVVLIGHFGDVEDLVDAAGGRGPYREAHLLTVA